MLNIINLLKKDKKITITEKKGDTTYIHRRNIPLSKEWYNSIYAFNKNPMKIYPGVHDFLFKLLKRHFNIYNQNFEKFNKSREKKRIRRSLSNNKVWVSTPEIKHLNEKVIITIYVYNRLYGQIKKQLNSLSFTWGPLIAKVKKKIHYKDLMKNRSKSLRVTRVIEALRRKNPIYVGNNKMFHSKSNSFYIRMIKWLKSEKFKIMEQYKSSIIELISKNNIKLLNGINNLKIERYNYLINSLKKELIYLKLKQKMLFNRFKFTELSLAPIVNILQTIYKKEIEFNIVIVKYHYISSSILTQIATLKVKNKKNRGNASRPVSHAITNNYLPNLSGRNIQREEKMSVGMQNVILNSEKENYTDLLNKFLLTNKKSKVWSSRYIDNFAMQNIENKSVSGLFIKLSGRLTKRYKAQRAINIFKHRGTLKNTYSAHKGYSSVLSRGYSNINVEKTIIHSKLRIGAFGLTGWVASC